MKELKIPFFTVLFILVGIFLYIKLAGPIPFSVNSVQTSKSNLFSVTGTGKATDVPDTTLLSFGVTKTAPNVLTAQEQVNTTSNKITNDLKNLGIDEKNIKTTNYSVYPNLDYSNGRQNITGYTVSQNLEVKIKPIDKANKAIDIATSDGANMVGGITFILNDEAKKKLENKAREEAIKNAKEKAESLASLYGIRLGKIIDVQESGGIQPHPIMIESRPIGDVNQEKSTEINPGESTISITVTLSYKTF